MPRALTLATLLLAACASKDDGSGPDTDLPDSDGPESDVPVVEDSDSDAADSDGPGDTAADTDVAAYAALPSATDGPFTGPWVARGGTRLAVVHVRHEGAPHAVFSHFHDTVLGVDCAFRRATDDVMRCLPVGGEPAETLTPDCASEAVTIHGSCGAVPYALQPEPPRCGLATFGVRTITVDPSASTYGVKNPWKGGACEARELPEGHVLALAEPEPVPPSTFVAGALRAVATGGDVDVVVVLADDGAVAPLGFFDPARRVPCRPVEVVGDVPGVTRCVPTTDIAALPHPLLDAFGDASCTTTTAAVTAEAPCDDGRPDRLLDPASPGLRLLGTDPIRATELVRLREEIAAGYQAWSDTFGRDVCDLVERPGTNLHGPLRRLGRTLDPARFPALYRVGVPANGVRVNAWRDAGGRLLLPVARRPFVDQGEPCVPVVDPVDGTARCAPLPYAYRGTWSACVDDLLVLLDGPAAPGTEVLRTATGRACFGARNDVADHGRVLVIGQAMPRNFVPREPVVSWPGVTCRETTRAEVVERYHVAEPGWAKAAATEGLGGFPGLAVEP